MTKNFKTNNDTGNQRNVLREIAGASPAMTGEIKAKRQETAENDTWNQRKISKAFLFPLVTSQYYQLLN